MKSYLELLELILNHGKEKHPTRVESGAVKYKTIGLANLHFIHNLTDGFPLITTRPINWTGLVGELRAFLLGATNNKTFLDLGCKFWTPWARPDGDLGPIYGAQWNAHGQLSHVLHCLRNNPNDRRMVVSAWRSDEHVKMVLPPCHVMWIVTPYNGVLNLSWIQRSCDFPIGVPYNIASYALLAHILAKWANMEVGTIDCIFCDAHIYENQIPGVREQLQRIPYPLPSVHIWFDNDNDFNSWQVHLSNYHPQPAIDFGEVLV